MDLYILMVAITKKDGDGRKTNNFSGAYATKKAAYNDIFKLIKIWHANYEFERRLVDGAYIEVRATTNDELIDFAILPAILNE